MATKDRSAVEAHRFAGRAMASGLSLTVLTHVGPTGARQAKRAWSKVIAEFESSEASLSRFRETSAVTALNRASLRGIAMRVDRRLAVAVHAADRAHRLTDGQFDPRVVGQLDGWGYAGANLGGPVPTAALAAPERIVRRIDRDHLQLGYPIDLGGIGKGLAVRWAAQRVRQTGIERFLLDAGGDIAAHGPGPDDGPWSVGLEDPSGGEPPVAVMTIADGAVATSSIRRLRWTVAGRVRHHLVDPATGEPADGGLVAVTVAGADPAWAEVWSKALFVAGRNGIAALARARGLAAWWVAEDGALEMTPAARVRTIWVAGEA